MGAPRRRSLPQRPAPPRCRGRPPGRAPGPACPGAQPQRRAPPGHARMTGCIRRSAPRADWRGRRRPERALPSAHGGACNLLVGQRSPRQGAHRRCGSPTSRRATMRAAAQTPWAAGGAEPGRANPTPILTSPGRPRRACTSSRRNAATAAVYSRRFARKWPQCSESPKRSSRATRPRRRSSCAAAPPGCELAQSCGQGHAHLAGQGVPGALERIAGLPGRAAQAAQPSSGAGRRPLPPTCLPVRRPRGKKSRFGIH